MKREITTHTVPGGFNPLVSCETSIIGDAYVIRSPVGVAHCLAGVRFQHGPPAEAVNGVTVESLLAVCMDKLQQHQLGPYPCQANELALQDIERAMESLKDRTRERTAC